MATIKELLKQLPLQKRLQAMENIRLQEFEGFQKSLSREFTGLENALSGIFVFKKTRQGHEYWTNIINQFK